VVLLLAEVIMDLMQEENVLAGRRNEEEGGKGRKQHTQCEEQEVCACRREQKITYKREYREHANA
jgi:hypothetical protein